MVFLTVNYESNKILTSKTFGNGSRKINSSFRPIKLEYLPEKVVIGTILYRAYYNLVFSLCYAKITLGKFYLLKLINIKTIAIRIMYLLLGISRIAIKIIKIIIKIDKNTSLEEILFIELYRPNDLRLILKINGEWCVNGRFSLLIEKIGMALTTKNTHLDEKAIKFVAKKISKSCEDLRDVKNETLTYSAKFITNKDATPHWLYPESTENKTSIGYRTDKLKADINKNYGRKIIINQFSGKSKKSTFYRTSRGSPALRIFGRYNIK